MIVSLLDTWVLSFGGWGGWCYLLDWVCSYVSGLVRGCLNVSWIRLLVNRFVIKTLCGMAGSCMHLIHQYGYPRPFVIGPHYLTLLAIVPH